jgi:hypothetical protein
MILTCSVGIGVLLAIIVVVMLVNMHTEVY